MTEVKTTMEDVNYEKSEVIINQVHAENGLDNKPFSSVEKETPQPVKTQRRVEIDLIMIFLTYGIYVYHLCLVYRTDCSWFSLCYLNLSNNTLSEDTFTTIPLGLIREWFVWFMSAWNMPMFFFLSGQNAYSALCRRTETQFRDERVHRLLVPTLFLSAVTQFPHAISYFAPHLNPLKESFGEYVRGFYTHPGVNQAWFLLYLFIYAQMFAFWFRAYHPNHNNSKTDSLSYCGSTSCCCTEKPFNCLTKLFCCLCMPQSGFRGLLEGPIKLAVYPGLILTLLEYVQFGLQYAKILPWITYNFPFFSYMGVYVLGYAVGATDIHTAPSKLCGWIYLLVGFALCTAYGVIVPEALTYTSVTPVAAVLGVLAGLTRGFGMWLLMIGLVAVMRYKYTTPKEWHRTLREMAMPFYLIHEQILVAYAAAALWVPYLRTFPLMLVITSLLILPTSFLITKSGPLRYFFGLPPAKDSCLPGKKLRGFVPVIILAGLVLLHILLANLIP